MSILDTLMGQQSAAFRIAESANRFGDITKAAELAVSVGAGAHTQALATHISAISAAHKSFATAFEPSSAMAAQLQLFDNKMLAVLAPIKEATEKMSALSAALKINTSFHDLGKAPAFTQIRLFEKITGDRLLKLDEEHFLNKVALSKSFVPTYAGIHFDPDFNYVSPASLTGFTPIQPVSLDDFTPVQSVTVDDLFQADSTYLDDILSCRESLRHSDNLLEAQQFPFDHPTDCPTKHLVDPNFRPRPDYLGIIADRNLSIEERGRAFALSGLPFHYWANYFCDEDFDTWVEDEVETAKRHRERILCFVNKINQIYRRASRIILQAYRRLNKSWKNSFVFSWRHAYLNQIHTLKDAEIKLSDFFISTTLRHSRESSFFSYEFCRKHDFPPPGNSL